MTRTQAGATGMTDRSSLRLAAALLLAGQLLYIVITLFHAGGDANDHATIFATYASSGSWTIDHIGQFTAMAILTGGLIALFYAVDVRDGTARWTGRFAVASAICALAMYGALQAVDGVANKLVDVAWLNAPEAERTARFASAEAVRWIEWGMRSYQAFLLGLALLLLAIAAARTAWIPKPTAFLMGLSGLAFFAQGWIVGTEGFSATMSNAIILAEILNLVWMVWLVRVASRIEPLQAPAPA